MQFSITVCRLCFEENLKENHKETCTEKYKPKKFVSSKEWISVNDNLPEKEKDVLIFDEGKVKFGIYSSDCYGDKFFSTNFEQFLNTENVTHWMELPLPPEMTNE